MSNATYTDVNGLPLFGAIAILDTQAASQISPLASLKPDQNGPKPATFVQTNAIVGVVEVVSPDDEGPDLDEVVAVCPSGVNGGESGIRIHGGACQGACVIVIDKRTCKPPPAYL